MAESVDGAQSIVTLSRTGQNGKGENMQPVARGAATPVFNPVIVALFSISVMCGLYIGLNERMVPPHAAALGFLVWGVLPHAICLSESIKHGHTEAACVLVLFLGFWLFFGVGLLALPAHDLHLALRFAEPVIAIGVFVLSYYYRHKKSLARILIGLGLTVAWLWLSKLIGAPARIGSLVVGALGVWVLVTVILQLNQHQAKGRASATSVNGQTVA